MNAVDSYSISDLIASGDVRAIKEQGYSLENFGITPSVENYKILGKAIPRLNNFDFLHPSQGHTPNSNDIYVTIASLRAENAFSDKLSVLPPPKGHEPATISYHSSGDRLYGVDLTVSYADGTKEVIPTVQSNVFNYKIKYPNARFVAGDYIPILEPLTAPPIDNTVSTSSTKNVSDNSPSVSNTLTSLSSQARKILGSSGSDSMLLLVIAIIAAIVGVVLH